MIQPDFNIVFWLEVESICSCQCFKYFISKLNMVASFSLNIFYLRLWQPSTHRSCELNVSRVSFLDIMVCTGCCGTLDFIVTHLFKTLSKRRKKNSAGMENQPPCLRILESHPEMIQQVR